MLVSQKHLSAQCRDRVGLNSDRGNAMFNAFEEVHFACGHNKVVNLEKFGFKYPDSSVGGDPVWRFQAMHCQKAEIAKELGAKKCPYCMDHPYSKSRKLMTVVVIAGMALAMWWVWWLIS